jgi:hypothetical protein
MAYLGEKVVNEKEYLSAMVLVESENCPVESSVRI